MREFVAREQESVKSATSSDVMPKVLQGRCPPYGDSITYWPLIEILRSLLQVQEDESNETLQLRFMAFVNEALTKAARTEQSEEIASTILRSIGPGLRVGMNSPDGQNNKRHTSVQDVSINAAHTQLVASNRQRKRPCSVHGVCCSKHWHRCNRSLSWLTICNGPMKPCSTCSNI